MPISRLVSMPLLALALLTGTASATAAGLPATMRAAAFDQKGAPGVITLHTLPVPTVGADEVLIATHVAGIGVWDSNIRREMSYISKPHFPFVMGNDGSGLVASVGSAVTQFKVGDPVYAYNWDNPKGGFYAEYIAIQAKHVAHVPKGMSLEKAGALGVSGLTALQGIDDALHIKAGEKLIIYGASGAVGTLAIQFAKLRGARVLAVASGDDGLALVRKLGADAAVDGRRGDIVAAAKSFAPGGADAVLALAGGEGLQRSMDALRTGGRLAFPNGIGEQPKARDGLSVMAYDAIAEPAQLAHLNEAVEARKFEIPIAAEFPLADAAKAHERMEAGHLLGKIVLKVR